MLLMVLWLFETVFLSRMYESIRRDEIEKAITPVERNIDSPSLGQLIRGLADEQEIIVTPVHDFSPPDRPDPGENRPGGRRLPKRRSLPPPMADPFPSSFTP